MRPAFHEVQHLSQWWVRVPVLLVTALAWWAFVAQILLGEAFGDHPAPDWTIWLIAALAGIALPALIFLGRLVVTVDGEAIRIRWIPFAWRRIPLSHVESAAACTYRPIRDYGGYGVRWSPGRGWAWNASGNRGVEVTLASGKRILIGSRRPEELEAAIRASLASRPGS